MKTFILIILSCFCLNAFSQSYYGIHQVNLNNEIVYPFNKAPVIKHQKQNVNFITKNIPYSITYHAWKPAELVNKVFKFKVSLGLKRNTGKAPYKLIISADLNDSALFYQDKMLEVSNKWSTFSDSVTFPFNMDVNLKYKVFVFNQDNLDTLFIKDFKIEYFEMPQLNYVFRALNYGKVNVSDAENLFENKYYKLKQIKSTNNLFISNSNNEALSGVFYTTIQTKSSLNQEGFHSSDFKLISQKNSGDSVFFDFRNNNLNINCNVRLVCLKNSPQVFFYIAAKALSSITLNRLALTIPYFNNLNEVYSVDAKRYKNDFIQSQYWLGKRGGFVIGNNTNTLSVLKTPGLSSLQIDNNQKLMVFNVDFALDHPLLFMPLLQKEENKKEDRSCFILNKDSSIVGEFSLTAGFALSDVPLINPHYKDYKSTFIFTEHADWATLQTHRAIYFGRSDIINAEDASGGFVKYKIPVTKSVFYHNPYNSQLKEVNTQAFLQKPLATLKENPDFKIFIKQLFNLDYEICLHSPEDKSTQKLWADEAMSYTLAEYGANSWIDHGYDNAMESNREDFSCDGAIENSPFYMVDLWKKNKVKYFWNPYFEDFPLGNNFQFYSSILMPHFGLSTSVPKVSYSVHPNYPDFFQWYTYSVTQAQDPALWRYFFNDQRLLEFINFGGTFISHIYPASLHNEYGFLSFSGDTIKVNPEFDSFLARLADYRNNRMIYISTIKRWMDDVLSKEQLVYKVINERLCLQNISETTLNEIGIVFPDGKIKIVNLAAQQFIELNY